MTERLFRVFGSILIRFGSAVLAVDAAKIRPDPDNQEAGCSVPTSVGTEQPASPVFLYGSFTKSTVQARWSDLIMSSPLRP